MLVVTQPREIYNQTKLFYCDPIKLVTDLTFYFSKIILELLISQLDNYSFTELKMQNFWVF